MTRRYSRADVHPTAGYSDARETSASEARALHRPQVVALGSMTLLDVTREMRDRGYSGDADEWLQAGEDARAWDDHASVVAEARGVLRRMRAADGDDA